MRPDDTRITTFVSRLRDLDTGERARLKRNAGKEMAESYDVLGLFYRLLPPGVEPRDEPRFFLVATLFPLTGNATEGNFGDALRRIRTDENAQSLDRRFEVLLDADVRQLPYYLRQAVRMLAAREVAVPWASLLADLTSWTHPQRFVQRAWARSYFASQPASTEEK